MTYTLPQRNGFIEQIVELEAKLSLQNQSTLNKSTAELEQIRDDLYSQVELTNACKSCGSCGC